MEKQEKNALLTQLYALRAGMSVISTERDETDSLNHKLQLVEQKEQQDLNMLLQTVKKKKEKLDIYEERAGDKTHAWLFILLLIGEICAGIALAYLLFLGGKALCALEPKWWIVALLAGLLGWVCYFLAVSSIVGIFSLGKYLVERIQDEFDDKEYIQEIPLNIIKMRKEIEKLSAERKNLQAIATKRKGALSSQINQKANDCVWVSGALREQFSNVLDERDWQNVDLIIFYFETGRADDLKEALQLVDKQIQNDQIVNAVHMAGNNICTTIQEGMMGLQASMVQCFSLLSEQLISMQQTQQAQIASLEGTLQNLTGSLNNMVTATNLSNALQQKANTSSLQLAEDMRYMRGVAEREEIAKRNR